jgi:hypothetical protein
VVAVSLVCFEQLLHPAKKNDSDIVS